MYEPVINLGRQPRHANGFVTEEQFGTEDFFEMVVGFDQETKAIRLLEPCKRELMFNDQYAFYSKTSKKMQEHFAKTALALQPYVDSKGGIVVEVGSNDGVMQDAWAALGVKSVGVEPSANVAQLAQENGHEVLVQFMEPDTAYHLRKLWKIALVYGANVSCHITELDSYFDAIEELLKDGGVFVFEDPYFLDVWEKCSYDQFYGEHTWMFTVQFLSRKLRDHGLEIFDLEHLWTHGGSMRYFVAQRGARNVRPSVRTQCAREGNLEPKLIDLALRMESSRKKLREILQKVKGKAVCGFGATSKGVVVTNYCGIGTELVPFITDTTPTKIGKFYPGSHIPIVAQEETDYTQFEYIINFAWNHFDEIREARKDFHGQWITHVPYPQIV